MIFEEQDGEGDGEEIGDGLRKIDAHGLVGRKHRRQIDQRQEQHELAHDGDDDRRLRIADGDERHLAGDLDAEHEEHAAVNAQRLSGEGDQCGIGREDRREGRSRPVISSFHPSCEKREGFFLSLLYKQ